MISFSNDRNGGGLYPSEIAKANTAMITLFHCGARGVRALSMLVDKMRAPLQLGWSPSLLSRSGLVLFVGEAQKEGQLSTNSIFCEGQKTVFNQRLSCETHHSP